MSGGSAFSVLAIQLGYMFCKHNVLYFNPANYRKENSPPTCPSFTPCPAASKKNTH
jgi:hypothetical protein